MASKKDDLDNFELDDLDWGELEDFDLNAPKAKGGPVRRVSTSFAKGARDGLLDPAELRRFASAALPQGYTTALNGIDEIQSVGRGLYDIAASELKPADETLRRLTKQSLPKIKSFLPEKLVKKLEEYTAAKEGNRSEESLQTDQITQELGELFGAQAEAQAEQRATDRQEQIIRDKIDERRSKDRRQLLSSIATDMRRLTAFNNDFTSRYQRKNLELQYRQLFTQRSIHSTLNEFAATQKSLLDAVVHNTSLSEQQKLSISHRAGGSLKDRMINGFQQKSVGFLNNYTTQLTKNLQDRVREAASALSSGITGAGDMVDELQTVGEIGGDPLEMGGEMAGKGAVSILMRSIGRNINRRTNPNGKVSQQGARLERLWRDRGSTLNDFALSESDGSFVGSMLSALKSGMPTHRLETRFGGNSLLNADKPATFDNLTRKSITQIIPEYLSKIHQELSIMRTGDSTKSALMYNLDKEEFTDRDTLKKDVKSRLMDSSYVGNARAKMGELLKTIDPENKLSSNASNALAKQLMFEAANGSSFDPKKLSSFDYSTPYLIGAEKEEVAAALEARFNLSGGGTNEVDLNNTSKQFSEMRNATPDLANAMRAMSQAYSPKLMEELGYLKRTGRGVNIDHSKIFDEILFDKSIEGSIEEQKKAKTDFFSVKMEEGQDLLDRKVGAVMDRVLKAVNESPTAQRAIGAAKRQASKAGAVVKRGMERARSETHRLNERANQLFVVEQEDVALDIQKLDAGLYQDSVTGQTLASWSDIENGVSENGVPVLTKAEVMRGLEDAAGNPIETRLTQIKNGYGSVSKEFNDLRDSKDKLGHLKGRMGSLTDGAKRKLRENKRLKKARLRGRALYKKSGAQKQVTTATTFASNQMQTIGQALQKKTGLTLKGDGLFDAQGNELLSLTKLQNGEYRDALTGQIVNRVEDISGPMRDADGNFKLDAKQLAGGVHDRMGRELSEFRDRANARIEDLEKQLKERLDGKGSTFGTENAGSMVEVGGDLIVINQQQLEMLAEIRDAILSVGMGGGEGGSGGPGLLRRGLGFGGRMVKGAGKLYAKYVKGVGETAWWGAKTAVSGAFGALTGGREFFADVYVKGEKDPVLYAKKMRNGDYVDQESGKPIKSVRGIKGAVLNELGEIVLTKEQYASGLYYTRGGKFVKAAWATVTGAAGALFGAYGQMFKIPFLLTKKAFSMANSLLAGQTKPADVYVKGENKPRLYARGMRNGEYFNIDKPKKPIRHPGEIEGPVIDAQGNTLISQEDFQKGLVNVFGLPFNYIRGKIRAGLTRVVGGAISAASAVVSGAIRATGAVVGLGYKAIAGAAGWAGSKLMPKSLKGMFKRGGLGSKDPHLAMLTSIYELLDERIAIPERLKDGSWQKRFKDAASKKKDKADKAEREKHESKFGMGALMGWLKGKGKSLFGWGGDDEDEDEDDGGGGNTTVIAGGGGDGKGKRKPRAGGPKGGWRRNRAARKLRAQRAGRGGFLSRMGGKLGRFRPRGGGIGGLAAGVGMGLGGSALVNAAGGSNSTAGKAIDTGVSAAGWGLTALSLGKMAGLGGLASSAGGALGTAAVGIGGLLSAPVLLAGAAVVGVGALGYLGYKVYRNLKDQPFRKLRLAQYGVPHGNIKMLGKIEQLEKACRKAAVISNNRAHLSEDKLDVKDVMGIFDLNKGWFSDISEEQQARAPIWGEWFQTRFKPVFLNWLSTASNIDASMDLDSLDDKLKPEQKQQLLDGVRNIEANYQTGNPFPESVGETETGTEFIQKAVAEIEADLKGEKRDPDKHIQPDVKTNAGSALAAAAAAKGAVMDTTPKTKLTAREALRDATSNPSFLQKIPGIGSAITAWKFARSYFGTSAASVTNVTALMGIRYRAYGLKLMETDKVNALATLEQELLNRVTFNGGNVPSVPDDLTEILGRVMPMFGVTEDPGAQVNFRTWLNGRFLPVLLTFAAAVRAVNKDSNLVTPEKTLSPGQLVAVAKAIVATKGRLKEGGDDVDVWKVTFSPWENYRLNTDAKSTDEAMALLKEAGKDDTLKEEAAKASIAQKQAVEKRAADREEKSLASRAFDSAKSVMQNVTSRLTNAATSIKDRVFSAASSVSQGNFGEAASTVAGMAPAALSALAGIQVKPLQLKGSAADLEALMIQEAHKAGITDPEELAMFMGQMAAESGNFEQLEENLRYRPENARRVFPKYFSSTEEARAVLARGIPAFAEVIYGKRMGNTEVGDGYKYRGRGPIQLTGKENYIAFSRWSGIDAVNNPDLLATDPAVAAKSALFYWMTRVRGRAQVKNLNQVTRAINGGYNGLEHRRAAVVGYTRKFQGQSMEQILSAAAAVQPNRELPTVAGSTGDTTTTTANGPAGGLSPTAPATSTPSMWQNITDGVRGGARTVATVATAGAAAATAAAGYAINAVTDSSARSSGAKGRKGSLKASRAAEIATRTATPKSRGLCAKAVSDAMLAAGYKFTKQTSAYMYKTNGILESIGFKPIAPGGELMVGDIMTFDKTGRRPHGHIQIYNGQQWVSDFTQRSANPYPEAVPTTLWRDGNTSADAATGSSSAVGFSAVPTVNQTAAVAGAAAASTGARDTSADFSAIAPPRVEAVATGASVSTQRGAEARVETQVNATMDRLLQEQLRIQQEQLAKQTEIAGDVRKFLEYVTNKQQSETSSPERAGKPQIGSRGIREPGQNMSDLPISLRHAS